MQGLTQIKDGGVTSAKGFLAGGVFAGIKHPGRDKRDLGLLFSPTPCAVAGTFSQNSVLSPSVVVSRECVQSGTKAHGLVVESGSANCAVGEQGFIDARQTVALAAQKLEVEPNQILIATTGLIGTELPMQLIAQHLPNVQCTADGGMDFARAMLTTDTRPKHCAVEAELANGTKITIGGAAKGSGMVHPNMATMLAFVTTDAPVEARCLQAVLGEAVELTFNQIDIDGDQSTNDMVVLFANGAAGGAEITADSADFSALQAGVRAVCQDLAISIARDAEGGKNRLLEVEVVGAESDADARKAARSVASSLLVKTAVYGHDPNWGRIMMAVGKAQVALSEPKLQIFINGIQIVDHGISVPFNVQSVVGSLAGEKVALKINLAVGKGRGLAWGGEITEEYVVFNSAYTT